ncbi:MAG: RloB family protein [Nitrosospira sp.]
MSRSAQSLNRGKSRYKPQPRILVICEDSKSGKQYLDDAASHFRVNLIVEIAHCGRTDPRGIVEKALEREANYEQVYCMIDRDQHENFAEALKLAENSKKTIVIISYPCFEFWLLLHFGYCRKPYVPVGSASAAEQLIRDLRVYPGFESYAKGDKQNIFKLLKDKLVCARTTAPKILSDAITAEAMNPSTQIHLLFNVLEKLMVPQPI